MNSMTTTNKEIESFVLLKDISDSKKQLESILEKYQVNDPEEIEVQVREGTIPEHPAYEDYLSAIAFR
jgi:hypothetical protein